MTREDFNNLLTAAADPDQAPDALLSISDGVKELFDNAESFENEKKNYEDKIAELRDRNAKLFLRVTGTPAKTPEEDNRPFIERLSEKIFKED